MTEWMLAMDTILLWSCFMLLCFVWYEIRRKRKEDKQWQTMLKIMAEYKD